MDRYQLTLEAYENAFRVIRREERLTVEASIEELCKILTLKLYFENGSRETLEAMTCKLQENPEPIEFFFSRLFMHFVPTDNFKGWEQIHLGKVVFIIVVEELAGISFQHVEDIAHGRAFSEFLEKHYTGYLSSYTTPNLLGEYIFNVLGSEVHTSLLDPCCGLGGLLIEACKRKPSWLHLTGWDISLNMANTTRLHLALYGYGAFDILHRDAMKEEKEEMLEKYDSIIADLPNGYGEDMIISKVLDLLKPNGVAALIVSDAVLLSDSRRGIRQRINNYSQIINISRLEGVPLAGATSTGNYNILFLRNRLYPSDDLTTATLLPVGCDRNDIFNASEWVNGCVQGYHSLGETKHSKYFYMSDMKDWNIQLLFLYNNVGRKYPLVQLGELIARHSERVDINPDMEYTLLTVRNKGLGVEERKRVKGNEIKSKFMYQAVPGDLIISTLEADKGAIGIIPQTIKQAVISRNFMSLDVDKLRVLPEYLWMALNSKAVQSQLQNLNEKSYSMSRISYVRLSSVVIPLPSMEEQQVLVKPLLKSLNAIRKEQEQLAEQQEKFEELLFGKN